MRSGYKPFAHQVETVIFLLQHKRAYNFSDLGTGKTSVPPVVRRLLDD
jgi:hypothetical protein